MDKKIIAKNFSRYASIYDKYADVQMQAALGLIFLAKEDNLKNILEFGCGTGIYTLLLRDKFKRASIRAVDISDKMIAVAQEKLKLKGIEFNVADAENISFDQKFDLITSNATVQWFEDLGNSLSKFKSMLKNGGIVSFSAFGPSTFFELNSDTKAPQPCLIVTNPDAPSFLRPSRTEIRLA